MISAEDIKTLRAIARAGDDYDKIKRELAALPWKIVEDNVAALGFLCVTVPGSSIDEQYRLIIGYCDPERPPYLLLSFFLSR